MPLMNERLVVVGAPQLWPTGVLSPAEVAGFPLIQQATRPRLWADWFTAAGSGPVEHLRGPRFQHFDMVIAAARARLGLALLPDIVASDIGTGALRQVADLVLNGPTPYALITPATRPMSPSLQVFADWLRNGSPA